jgi:hypothetical protein
VLAKETGYFRSSMCLGNKMGSFIGRHCTFNAYTCICMCIDCLLTVTVDVKVTVFVTVTVTVTRTRTMITILFTCTFIKFNCNLQTNRIN